MSDLGILLKAARDACRRTPHVWHVIVIAVLMFICLQPAPVSAHSLKIDGTMAGILHTNPDDNPLSGIPTDYVLFLYDNSGSFSPALCNCTITMKEHGRTIASQPLELNSQGIPGGAFTFPKADTYDVVVHGSPNQSGAFDPFTLDYTLRVEPGPGVDKISSTRIAALLAGTALLAAIAVLVCIWQVMLYHKPRKDTRFTREG